MTITTPTKQKAKKFISTTPKTPGFDRSDSVQGIISAQDKVSYDQVFKTRNRVIDDRQTPPPKNFKDSIMVAKELFSLPENNTANPVSPTKSIRSQQSKSKSLRTSKSLQESTGESRDLKEMLKTSSEIFMLPEIELKYLDQYRVDSMKLRELEQRIDQAEGKTKEITKFINYQILKEEILMTPTIIKIQAWWRGVMERQRLKEQGKLLNFSRTRYYPDLKLAHKSATVIQARWRGCRCRYDNSTFQINLLKNMISSLRKQLLVQQGSSRSEENIEEMETLRKQAQAQDTEISELRDSLKSQADLISEIQSQLAKLSSSNQETLTDQDNQTQ